LRITCQWVKRIEACAVGDLAAVGILLKQVSAFGKLTRSGWGTISDIKIDDRTRKMVLSHVAFGV
jgi:CRISPR type IV-associated protein Csf3